jgi:hexosaminidase
MDNEQIAEYMIFPRVMALAETTWSVKENRDYAGFLIGYETIYTAKKLKIHAADTFDEITYTIGKGADGKTTVGLHTTLPLGVIRYTTDGSAPGKNAKIYDQLLIIHKDETINAAVFKNGIQSGRVFQKRFYTIKLREISKTRFSTGREFNPGIHLPLLTESKAVAIIMTVNGLDSAVLI